MNIVFYGNRQAGMVGLLTAMVLGHHIVEVWEDEGYGILGIDELPLRRRVIRSKSDLVVPDQEVDLLLCVHGRRIIPKEVLKRFRLGGINLHPFLGKYPGANPVERAILAGEREATVYAHIMTAQVDRGEVVAHATINIPTKFELPALDVVHIYNELYPLYAKVTAIVLKKLALLGLRED